MYLLFCGLCYMVGAFSMPHYTVGNWIDLKPNASINGQMLDSVEYQMLLPASKFFGVDGRKRDLASLKRFLKTQLGNVNQKSQENIRLVTLYDISLMDPSQDQEEAETEWELKQRLVLEGQNIGETDLTIKRGAVPDHFDWYPDYTPMQAVGAKDVENKFELDIQCAERDYTQAIKFTFPPGVVPILQTYRNLQNYFPKLFQTRELNSHLQNRLSAPLPVGEVAFEWNAEVKAKVLDLDVTFVIGTRHLSLESARQGDEGWAMRPPELNFRVKRKNLPVSRQQQTALLAALEQLFNAFLASEWNAHGDCGLWNGAMSCPPKFQLKLGECVSIGCEQALAPVVKIPRGASAAPIIPPLNAPPSLKAGTRAPSISSTDLRAPSFTSFAPRVAASNQVG